MIALSRRLARDPRWRNIATYTRACGGLALAGFVLMGLLVMPDDAQLHEWAGMAQRVLIIVVLFPCRIVLSLRLLQVAGHLYRTRLTPRSGLLTGDTGAR